MERPCDETAPEEDGHGSEAEDGGYDDEDGAFGQRGLLHERCVLGWWDGSWDDFVGARECG